MASSRDKAPQPQQISIQQLVLGPLDLATSPPLPSNSIARLEAIEQTLELRAHEMRTQLRLRATYEMIHTPQTDISAVRPPHQEPRPDSFQAALRARHDRRGPNPTVKPIANIRRKSYSGHNQGETASVSRTVKANRKLVKDLDDYEQCIQPVLKRVRTAQEEIRKRNEHELFLPWGEMSGVAGPVGATPVTSTPAPASVEESKAEYRPDLDPRRR